MKLRLDNGVEVDIRPIRAEDKALLAAEVDRLSADSAYRRFLGPKQRLTPRELVDLTEVDFRDHVAFVAVLTAAPCTMVAVGRWIRLPDDPEAAEVAYLVSDELQGQGLGTAIGAALARAARERGVKRFIAWMLPGNAPARHVLAGMSDQVLRTRIVDGMAEVEGRLAA